MSGKQLMIAMLENRIESSRETLTRQCESLAEELGHLVDRLRPTMPNHLLDINSLGEVQGMGPMIDAECAKLMTTVMALIHVKDMIED